MYKTGIIFTVSAFCMTVSLSFKNTDGFNNKQRASLTDTIPAAGKWLAPASADTIKSPFPLDQAAETKGAELFELYCKPCHGGEGYGDGGMGATFQIPPANFHSKEVKDQKNGVLFWKMTAGRGNMPSFKEVLTNEQRWQLIAFIRVLSQQ
ncbi:MAG TPA: cytochrome c class I [Sphingobacteriaceae bacterium]|nr:cytochrome c class I [Sphingobacteriaceae bacterium]